MTSTQNRPNAASRDHRTDGESINWTNVAVETAVMLRLQDAPPVAGARASMREARDVAAASRRP
jgi:hypothetical protein